MLGSGWALYVQRDGELAVWLSGKAFAGRGGCWRMSSNSLGKEEERAFQAEGAA